MKNYLLILIIFFCYQINAQDNLNESTILNTIVDKKAEYPGGHIAFIKFISDNIVYPDDIEKSGVELVEFIIDQEGYIIKDKIKIITSLSPTLDKEVIRVISLMPKWEPAEYKREKVKVLYKLPIRYNLE